MSRFDGSHAALTHENQEALSVVRPDLTMLKFHHRKVSSLTLHSFARKFNGVLARKEFEKTRKNDYQNFLFTHGV